MRWRLLPLVVLCLFLLGCDSTQPITPSAKSKAMEAYERDMARLKKIKAETDQLEKEIAEIKARKESDRK